MSNTLLEIYTQLVNSWVFWGLGIDRFIWKPSGLLDWYDSNAWCKTAVTPLLAHWSYCSITLSHRIAPLAVKQSDEWFYYLIEQDNETETKNNKKKCTYYIQNNAWVTVNNDFWLRVKGFAEDENHWQITSRVTKKSPFAMDGIFWLSIVTSP